MKKAKELYLFSPGCKKKISPFTQFTASFLYFDRDHDQSSHSVTFNGCPNLLPSGTLTWKELPQPRSTHPEKCSTFLPSSYKIRSLKKLKDSPVESFTLTAFCVSMMSAKFVQSSKTCSFPKFNHWYWLSSFNNFYVENSQCHSYNLWSLRGVVDGWGIWNKLLHGR